MNMDVYYLDRDHQRHGPVKPESLSACGVGPDNYVWMAGMKDWLLARDVQYRSMTGTGRAEKVQRDGVSYVTRIDIDVRVDVDEADRETLEHCLRIVKGCMITRSLMQGMEVEVHASRA